MGSEKNPVITTSDGQLLGKKAYTQSGTPYYTFKGIPFAKPPIGDLRFMAPQPVDPWDGIRDSTYERQICFQPKLLPFSLSLPPSLGALWFMLRSVPSMYRFSRVMANQSEDCLYLNVFTPKLPNSDSETLNYPVLFWIHGGGFLVGCGSEVFGNMDHFLDRGIVVVTINYRLGPFGFLSLGTDNAPGNAGMKDQVQALKWVQRNISQFGGNPNHVTIYGVSAGGASVHLLTVSPLANGLFHGAIAASGGALNEWSVTRNHVKHATEFAKILNVTADTPAELADKLKKVPAEEIVKALAKYEIRKDQKTLITGLIFTPSLERPGPTAFLSELPEDILREGRQAAVPFAAGVVLNEGSVWALMEPYGVPVEHFQRHPEKLMPAELFDVLSEAQRKEVASKIVKFYFGEKGICAETEPLLVDLYGHLTFFIPFLLGCRLHAATNHAPVYMYLFTFDGKLNGSGWKLLKGPSPWKVPGHGDEIGSVVPMQLTAPISLAPTDPEIKVRERLLGVLANFFKTGEPTFPSELNVDLVWNPITDQKIEYLELGQEFQIKHDKFGPTFEFWDGLFRKYLNKPLLPPK